YWQDLVTRAETPNVFMSPALIAAAAAVDPDLVALAAWQRAAGGPRLAGLWVFSVGRPRHSPLPIRVLRAPPIVHAYLSSPVLDRDMAEVTLAAMLDAIASAPDLPKIVALDALSAEPAARDALSRVVQARGSAVHTFATGERPMLASGLDAKSYFEAALSASSRKKLRQYRRRLGEKGRLETRHLTASGDVCAAFEQFLALETQGWKGRAGTALVSNPEDAAVARSMIAALAGEGAASIFVLELDGRPLSMQIVLRAGSVAFTWKTTYDEAYGDFSPGMLLLEDYTAALLEDSQVAAVDSCAFDANSYMGTWTERRRVADVWIGVGPSTQFRLATQSQRAFLRLRAAAKSLYLRARKGAKSLNSRIRLNSKPAARESGNA
ncbi:MAG TPA: GNAT family N-acetyltransferase, partial [Pseudolabrys sp.]|nr:GNAT family N-acetyltransferase [Pseudolabrys sp.]